MGKQGEEQPKGKHKATMHLDDEVWKRVRIKSIEENRSASEITEEALREKLLRERGQ